MPTSLPAVHAPRPPLRVPPAPAPATPPTPTPGHQAAALERAAKHWFFVLLSAGAVGVTAGWSASEALRVAPLARERDQLKEEVQRLREAQAQRAAQQAPAQTPPVSAPRPAPTASTPATAAVAPPTAERPRVDLDSLWLAYGRNLRRAYVEPPSACDTASVRRRAEAAATVDFLEQQARVRGRADLVGLVRGERRSRSTMVDVCG